MAVVFFLYLYVAGAVSRCCDALSLKREKGKKKREKNNEPVVVSMFVQLQQASLFSYCSHLYNLHCSAFFFCVSPSSLFFFRCCCGLAIFFFFFEFILLLGKRKANNKYARTHAFFFFLIFTGLFNPPGSLTNLLSVAHRLFCLCFLFKSRSECIPFFCLIKRAAAVFHVRVCVCVCG